MRRVKSMSWRRVLSVCVAVGVVAAACSGCASFRKKFVRKKKVEAQDTFAPVFVPVDYPRMVESPEAVYENHYVLARAYIRDIIQFMGSRDAGDKQQRYPLGQLAIHLQGMADLLTAQKKADLEQVMLQVQGLVKAYEKPGPLRRYDMMKGEIRQIEDALRRQFRPAVVQDALRSGP